MECKICETASKPIFKSKVLGKYEVQYYQCPKCKFVQTEEPYWLDEAYSSAITLSDTGIMVRNIYLSKIVSSILYFLIDKNSSYLDYAGGYGLFTRMMRDIGFEFFWTDPYCDNLVTRGFEYENQSIKVLTTFESFEHFANPKQELDKMLKISRNIIFTTQILPNSNLPALDWDYYGFEHGQHVSIHSKESLETLASDNGLHFYSNGFVHLFLAKKINPFLLKLIFKYNNYGLHYFVTKQLKSKTVEDMYLVRNRILNSK